MEVEAASMASPTTEADTGPHGRPLVRDLIADRRIRTLFQPIVDLRGGAVVGYEALSRGPSGTSVAGAAGLFAAGAAEGLEAELDQACEESALRAAFAAHLHPCRALFVNINPGSLATDETIRSREVVREALARMVVVQEITERAITACPAPLLAAAELTRQAGGYLAVDDVGSDPRSLALLPFLAPEVVKLDIGVTQTWDLAATARNAAAVRAHAERSGALVLAEGIETPEHLDTAIALGADYGQGWMFGRPRPLPPTATSAGPAFEPRRQAPPADDGATPYAIISRRIAPRRTRKDLLVRMSRGVEAHAAAEGPAVVVLASFQDVVHFTAASRSRYRRLAGEAALVGAIGAGIDSAPEDGVRGASLRVAEVLRGEWNVCVVGPYVAAALSARDLGDRGPDAERRFDYVMTHDRELVLDAARALMGRIADAGQPGRSAELR